MKEILTTLVALLDTIVGIIISTIATSGQITDLRIRLYDFKNSVQKYFLEQQ